MDQIAGDELVKEIPISKEVLEGSDDCGNVTAEGTLQGIASLLANINPVYGIPGLETLLTNIWNSSK